MDLGGIQGVFHHERVSFVQAQSPVSDRLARSAIPTASSTVPSTILVWPGSFGPSLTLQSNAFTHKTAATGDPLRPNCTRSCSHLGCERSPIKGGVLLGLPTLSHVTSTPTLRRVSSTYNCLARVSCLPLVVASHLSRSQDSILSLPPPFCI